MARGGIRYCPELLDLVVCYMCEERRHMYFKIEKNKPINQKRKACPMLTPVKNHQGCGHYILKWFVAIYGPAQR